MPGPYFPQGPQAPSPMQPRADGPPPGAPPSPNIPPGIQSGMSWDPSRPFDTSSYGNQPSLADNREATQAKVRALEMQLSRIQMMGGSPMEAAQIKMQIQQLIEDYQQAMGVARAQAMARLSQPTVGVGGQGGNMPQNFGSSMQMFDAMYGGIGGGRPV